MASGRLSIAARDVPSVARTARASYQAESELPVATSGRGSVGSAGRRPLDAARLSSAQERSGGARPRECAAYLETTEERSAGPPKAVQVPGDPQDGIRVERRLVDHGSFGRGELQKGAEFTYLRSLSAMSP